MSDNFRSKLGRRKPFIFLGGLLIVPAMLFLFAPWTWGAVEGSGQTVSAHSISVSANTEPKPSDIISQN